MPGGGGGVASRGVPLSQSLPRSRPRRRGRGTARSGVADTLKGDQNWIVGTPPQGSIFDADKCANASTHYSQGAPDDDPIMVEASSAADIGLPIRRSVRAKRLSH